MVKQSFNTQFLLLATKVKKTWRQEELLDLITALSKFNCFLSATVEMRIAGSNSSPDWGGRLKGSKCAIKNTNHHYARRTDFCLQGIPSP